MHADYDYQRLAVVGDDILLIEWDLAVDPDQLSGFVDNIRTNPDRVRVAPYRLYYQYADFSWGGRQHEVVWAHRRRLEDGRCRWVDTGEPTCHLFGFGLTYLPGELLAAYCRAEPGPMGDSSFSNWHYRNADDPEVVIDWECRPVHLNHPPLEV